MGDDIEQRKLAILWRKLKVPSHHDQPYRPLNLNEAFNALILSQPGFRRRGPDRKLDSLSSPAARAARKELVALVDGRRNGRRRWVSSALRELTTTRAALPKFYRRKPDGRPYALATLRAQYYKGTEEAEDDARNEARRRLIEAFLQSEPRAPDVQFGNPRHLTNPEK